MAQGVRTFTLRKLMAVLAPLTGLRASTTALVRPSTGSDVTLPAGCYVAPTVRSQADVPAVDRGRLFFVERNPDTEDGTWTVTPAGSSVAISSVLGGERHNLPADTVLHWDPPLVGLEDTATMEAAATGGADPTGTASVRRIVAYEDLDTAQKALRLFQAQSRGETPAIVLCWTGTGPAIRRNLQGSIALRPETWVAYVVVSRMQGALVRGPTGLGLLDLVESYLMGRGAVDGQHFSDPPVIVTAAGRHSMSPTSYVYQLQFTTHTAMERIDTRIADGQFGGWDVTRYDVSTATTESLPVITDARYPQP